MSFHSWLQNLRSAFHGRRRSLRAATHRPNLEVLEDRITPSLTMNLPGTQAETSIAIDATGQHVVIGSNDFRGFPRNPSFINGYIYSDDGGQTWVDGGQLPSPGDQSVGTTLYPQSLGDPDVKYLGGSNFVYSWVMLRPFTATTIVRTIGFHVSTDYGHTWQGPYEVTPATNPHGLVSGTTGAPLDIADKEFIDVDLDTGRVIMTWTNVTPVAPFQEIYVTYSDDILSGNPTWAPRQMLSTAGGVQGSIPRFAGGGSNAYAAWRQSTGGLNRNIFFSRSTDDGGTWSAPVALSPSNFKSMDQVLGNDRVWEFPSMATFGAKKVYVVYTTNANNDGGDIAFQRSTDGGQSFDAPILVNARPGADRAQWFPAVSVDEGSGRIFIMYYDQGIADSGDLTEVSFTYSDDGGKTWEKPRPLSDRPWHAGWGNDINQPNLGDYNQAVARSNQIVGVWAQSLRPPAGFSDGLPVLPGAFSMTVPDVFFARTRPGKTVSVNLGAVSFTDSGADGNIDPCDTVTLQLPLRNYVTNPLNAATEMNVNATLSTSTPGVAVLAGSSGYGNIAAGATALNLSAFQIQVTSGFDPGTFIDLSLHVTGPGGAEQTLPFTLFTGTPSATTLLSEDFEGVAPGTLPAGWAAVHGAGAVTVPWTTSNTFTGSNAAFHIDAGDGTRFERLFSPVFDVPAETHYVTIDMDVKYNTDDDPRFNVQAFDGFFLRVGHVTGGSVLRAVGVEAFADEFTTGAFQHYPKHLPRSSDPSYFEDMSAWAGDSGGVLHVHLRLPGMAGRTAQLRFEYTQDAIFAAASGPPGVSVDNIVVQSVVVIDPASLGAATSGNTFLLGAGAANDLLPPTLAHSLSTAGDNDLGAAFAAALFAFDGGGQEPAFTSSFRIRNADIGVQGGSGGSGFGGGAVSDSTFSSGAINDLLDLRLPDGEFLPTVMAGQSGGQLGDSPVRRADPNTTTSPFAGVGAVLVDPTPQFPSGLFGSGAAISPRHILTAAHIFDGPASPRDGVSDFAPGTVSFLLNFGGDLTHRIRASAIDIHPDYAHGSSLFDDVAIVTLEADLPAGVPIYPLRRQPLPVETVFTIVGYGFSGDGNTGIDFTSLMPSVKRSGMNVVEFTFRDDEGTSAREVMVWDFDHPQGNLPAPVVQFGGPSLGNQVETTIAFGDSGGPSFVTAADGSLELAAVNTHAFAPRANSPQPQVAPFQRAATFGTLGFAQLVPAHANWIDGIVHGPGTTTSQVSQADDSVSLAADETWLALIAAGVLQPVSFANVLVNDPTMDEPIALSDGTLDLRDTQSETTLVLGADGRIVVAYNDSGSVIFGNGKTEFTGYSVSSDGGQTFLDMGAPDTPFGDLGDPVLARSDRTGTIFLATLSGYTAPGDPPFFADERINIFRSTDNGVHFAAPVNGAPGFVPGVDNTDKEWLAVDNYPGPGYGNAYLAWLTYTNDLNHIGLVLTRSTDDGLTWGPDRGVPIQPPSPTDKPHGIILGAYPTVGPDHAVYVFWYDSSNGSTLLMRKSTDQGQTFGDPVIVTKVKGHGLGGDLGLTDSSGGHFTTYLLVQAAVNPATGDIYVIYHDEPDRSKDKGPKDKGDIFFVQSSDGGVTWSERVRVNDDTTTNDQWQPALAVTPDGSHVGVFWYDRRLDPANNLIDRFGVIGTASGHTVSFGANFRITDVSFPPAFDPLDPPPFAYMGDYDQAVADDSAFYITWGDNRLANPNYPPRVNQPDVRFARIPLLGLTGGDALRAVADSAPLLAAPTDSTAPNPSNLANASTLVNLPGIGGLLLDDPGALDAAAWSSLPPGDGRARFHPRTSAEEVIQVRAPWFDAPGRGWLVDPTPGDDSALTTPGDQGEQNRMDLFTALDLEYEIGHLLGLDRGRPKR